MWNIPKLYFFLIQDIKQLTTYLETRHLIMIHWIPSHISIRGNCNADKLAKNAQILSEQGPHIPDHGCIREAILERSVDLVWEISKLVYLDFCLPDGPSSLDDFSSANANQIIVNDNL